MKALLKLFFFFFGFHSVTLFAMQTIDDSIKIEPIDEGQQYDELINTLIFFIDQVSAEKASINLHDEALDELLKLADKYDFSLITNPDNLLLELAKKVHFFDSQASLLYMLLIQLGCNWTINKYENDDSESFRLHKNSLKVAFPYGDKFNIVNENIRYCANKCIQLFLSPNLFAKLMQLPPVIGESNPSSSELIPVLPEIKHIQRTNNEYGQLGSTRVSMHGMARNVNYINDPFRVQISDSGLSAQRQNNLLNGLTPEHFGTNQRSQDNYFRYMGELINDADNHFVREYKLDRKKKADERLYQINEMNKIFSNLENIHEISTYSGQRPIHIAVMSGNKTMYEYLIENGADINATNIEGDTPASAWLSRYLGTTQIPHLIYRLCEEVANGEHILERAEQLIVQRTKFEERRIDTEIITLTYNQKSTLAMIKRKGSDLPKAVLKKLTSKDLDNISIFVKKNESNIASILENIEKLKELI